jgi:hypothetical protein
LEDTLLGLREGRAVHVGYDTTFLINWPRHLGGGSVNLSLEGAMVLIPELGSL